MKRYLPLIAIVFLACKKEDNSAITKENLSGTYKISEISIRIGADMQNITNYFLPVCQQDDLQTLRSDYSYTYRDAGVVCNPAVSHEGIWDLQSNNRIVIDQTPFHIDSFDGHTLQLSDSASFNGQTYLAMYTWTRQ